MTSIEEIEKSLTYFDRYGKKVGVIILNAKDFDEIGGTFNKKKVWNPNTLFDKHLVIIPYHLYCPDFLKEGVALILEERYWDFLKGVLDGKRS